MIKNNPWIKRNKTSNEEMDEAISKFIKDGGKIQKLREDNGSYDKRLKQIQSKLEGGFNPFSKEESLTEK